MYLAKIEAANNKLRTMNIADDFAQNLLKRYDLLKKLLSADS